MPNLIGLILDISDGQMDDLYYIKRQVIELVEEVATIGDRFYFYQPDLLSIPDRKGMILPTMAQYRCGEMNLGEAIRQTTYLLQLEQTTEDKYVVVVTNQYSSETDYVLNKMQRFNLMNYWRINFLVWFVGQSYHLASDDFTTIVKEPANSGCLVDYFKRREYVSDEGVL